MEVSPHGLHHGVQIVRRRFLAGGLALALLAGGVIAAPDASAATCRELEEMMDRYANQREAAQAAGNGATADRAQSNLRNTLSRYHGQGCG